MQQKCNMCVVWCVEIKGMGVPRMGVHARRAIMHLEEARRRLSLCGVTLDDQERLADEIRRIQRRICADTGLDLDLTLDQVNMRLGDALAWARQQLVVGGAHWSSLADLYTAYAAATTRPVAQRQFAVMLSDAGVPRRVGVASDGVRRRLWHAHPVSDPDETRAWVRRRLIIDGPESATLGSTYSAYAAEAHHPVSQKAFAAVLADMGIKRYVGTDSSGRRRRLWRMGLKSDAAA